MLPGWLDFTARAKYWENLTEKRSGIKAEAFKPADFGSVSMAQILRTYDSPEREDIRRMYLKNIQKQPAIFTPKINIFAGLNW